MSMSGAAKISSRRSRAKAAPQDNSIEQAVEQEEGMVAQDKGNGGTQAAKAGKLDLAEKPIEKPENGHAESGLALRNEAAGKGSIEMAGTRPIGSTQLEIYATILNNRPIEASHLHIADYSLPGHRPVFQSDLALRDDLMLGGRPVMVSDPKLMESSGLPGGRPIASNDTVDGETMMGYLD